MSNSPLAKGGALSLLIHTQGVLLQLVIGVLLARLLGPENLGIYSFVLAMVVLVQVIPNSGLESVVVRFSSMYFASNAWGRLKGLWRVARNIALTYGALMAALVLAAASLGWLPKTYQESKTVFLVSAIALPLLPLAVFYTAALRSVTHGVIGQLPLTVLRPWSQLILIGGIFLILQPGITPTYAMSAYVASFFIAIVAGAAWLSRRRPIAITQITCQYETRRWLKTAIPLSLLGGLTLINTQADILMLGLLGTPHETGIYRVAASGAGIVALSLHAANAFIAPKISALHSTGEINRLQSLLKLSRNSTTAVSLATALLLWMEGGHLISLIFGKAYQSANAPMAILIAGQLINVAFGSVGLLLKMTGNENHAARAAAVAAVMNVAGNLILIPTVGISGAAISTAISTLAWNFLMHRQVLRILHTGKTRAATP